MHLFLSDAQGLSGTLARLASLLVHEPYRSFRAAMMSCDAP